VAGNALAGLALAAMDGFIWHCGIISEGSRPSLYSPIQTGFPFSRVAHTRRLTGAFCDVGGWGRQKDEDDEGHRSGAGGA
jgi:hypothetical protein